MDPHRARLQAKKAGGAGAGAGAAAAPEAAAAAPAAEVAAVPVVAPPAAGPVVPAPPGMAPMMAIPHMMMMPMMAMPHAPMMMMAPQAPPMAAGPTFVARHGDWEQMFDNTWQVCAPAGGRHVAGRVLTGVARSLPVVSTAQAPYFRNRRTNTTQWDVPPEWPVQLGQKTGSKLDISKVTEDRAAK